MMLKENQIHQQQRYHNWMTTLWHSWVKSFSSRWASIYYKLKPLSQQFQYHLPPYGQIWWSKTSQMITGSRLHLNRSQIESSSPPVILITFLLRGPSISKYSNGRGKISSPYSTTGINSIHLNKKTLSSQFICQCIKNYLANAGVET